MKYQLKDIISEYTEKNINGAYDPVAVGKYGIRKRSDIYKKELAKDYSKNKVIRKNTMIVGMGSTQIDIGVLSLDDIYSVSPAYHTFSINSSIIRSEYLDYLFQAKNSLYTSRYMIASARQGKTVNLKDMLFETVDIPDFDVQQKTVEKINEIKDCISLEEKQLALYDELIKSRFIEMFKNKDYPKTQIRNVVDIKKISAKKTYEKDDKIRYIDISSIDNSTNQVIGYTPYVFKHAPSRAQQCLKNGDILVSTVRPNLKNIAIFNGDSTDCVGSSGFCVLRASKCSTQYLKYIVLDDEFTEAMVKLTTGASYPAIRDDDVLDYEMIDAPIELQNKFADFVQQIDKSKFIVQKRIDTYKELLAKKMDEYFN